MSVPDKTSGELAVTALGFMSEQLSPLALEARRHFLSRLALEGGSPEELRGIRPNGQHNAELITEFCSQLPPVYVNKQGHYFLSNKQPEMQITQQASVAFVRNPGAYISTRSGGESYDTKTYIPHYIVGLSSEGTNVLLALPKIVAFDGYRHRFTGSLCLVHAKWESTSRKTAAALQAHSDAYRTLNDSSSIGRVRTQFHDQTGEYVAWQSTPGSLTLKNYAYGRQVVNHLTHTQFADLHVFDHLSKLALAFDEMPFMQRLFADSSSEAIEETDLGVGMVDADVDNVDEGRHDRQDS